MEHLQYTTFLEESLSARNVLASAFTVLVAYFVFNLIADNKSIPGFGIAGRKDGEWFNLKARQRFTTNSKGIVENGLKKFKNGIFQVFAHSGPQLILPVRYLDEIRNNPHMDLHGTSQTDFFSDYPAFKPMRAGEQGDLVTHMINRKLTTSLALITAPVNEENNIAMKRIWGETKEWKSTPFINDALDLTSQVSSRIFLGAPLCRDPEWIRLAKEFTVDLMTAAYTMRFMPKILRPVLYYVLPPVYKLKNTVKAASAIIEPEVKERRRLRNEALARGETIPKRLDSVDWMDDVINSQGLKDFDIVGAQLTLTFVAVHTTSNTLAHLLYDLIDNPELIPELRQEIIDVMEEDKGWQKTSLYKLKLLDSIMKESQRLHTLANLLMSRVSHEEVTLSDGTIIPKNARFSVPTLHMRDAEYYPNPNTFDGKRFLKLRELPENTNKYQFVTTSADHIGFGHGKHACPGRFFASNEIKIMICHLIMKYDWQFKDGKRPETLTMFSETMLDASAEILYKSRVSEVQF